jgi:hypothetical protein
MRYSSEGDVTQMMGIGHLGEVRQGPDGSLYQYVQGVDGLGNPIGGFWSRVKGLRGRLRKVVGRALPFAQRVASFIPGPYGAAVATALKTVTPILQKAGVAGYEGIGALYEAPDGSLYQVQGLAEDEDLRGIDDEMTQMMGIGYVGEMRQGPDGNLYQYVQGVDGLGNPIGSWLRRLVRRTRRFAPFIPGGAAALTAATPLLKKAGVAGYAGLAEDDELRGLAEDEELRGLEEDEELRGLDDDEDLRGLDEDEELRGFAEDEELRGVAEDQDMQGIEGYVRQDGMSGLEAYVPQAAPQTRWHVTPAQPPEVWKPLW